MPNDRLPKHSLSPEKEIGCPLDAVAQALEIIAVMNFAGSLFFKTVPPELQGDPSILKLLVNQTEAMRRAVTLKDWYKRNLEIMEKQLAG